jgi:hypothetical protein
MARWKSPDGEGNAAHLAATYADILDAIAEVDALGHRVLQRAATTAKVDRIDPLVGLAMLRRVVTQFVGIRHLMEVSAAEQAKLGVRSQFESLLAFRYLVHGGQRRLPFYVAASSRRRESRARYFYVAGERRDIYRQQALIDGRMAHPVRPAARRAIRKDIASSIGRLDALFPVQQSTFGPLRCYVPIKKKRQYYDLKEWYACGFRKARVNSVRGLAQRFGWLWEYEVLYDAFSGLTHPRGISHDINIENSVAEVLSPYLATAFELLCKWSLSWQMLILAWAVKAYHPASLPDAQETDGRIRPALNRLRVDVPLGFL